MAGFGEAQFEKDPEAWMNDLNEGLPGLGQAHLDALMGELAGLETSRKQWAQQATDWASRARAEAEAAKTTALQPAPHRGAGREATLAGTPCYVNGVDGGTCVVVGHDAWGSGMGNARQTVDTLALIFDGALVVMPVSAKSVPACPHRVRPRAGPLPRRETSGGGSGRAGRPRGDSRRARDGRRRRGVPGGPRRLRRREADAADAPAGAPRGSRRQALRLARRRLRRRRLLLAGVVRRPFLSS